MSAAKKGAAAAAQEAAATVADEGAPTEGALITRDERHAEAAAGALARMPVGESIGAGFEDAGAEAYAIPFLKVLQTNSPEVDESDGKHVAGAKPGMLLNSVTGELFDGKDGVQFIPAAYQRKFLRWAPRGSQQGFRGEMDASAVNALRDSGELKVHEGREYVALENGTVDDKKCDRVVDTRSHFGLIRSASGELQQVLLSLSSTQIKKSKLLMTLMMQKQEVAVRADGSKVRGPRNMFKNEVTITTSRESNDRGSWFGVHFSKLKDADSDAAAFGEVFHQSVTGGAVKVNYAEADVSGESAGVDPDKF